MKKPISSETGCTYISAEIVMDTSGFFTTTVATEKVGDADYIQFFINSSNMGVGASTKI